MVRRLTFAISIIMSLSLQLNSSTMGSNLSSNERDTILKGMYHMCVAGTPKVIMDSYGPIKIELYCSCYADELSKNISHEDFLLMMVDPTTGRAKGSPNAPSVMQNANKICLKELQG